MIKKKSPTLQCLMPELVKTAQFYTIHRENPLFVAPLLSLP